MADHQARARALIAIVEKATPGHMRTNRHTDTDGRPWGWLDRNQAGNQEQVSGLGSACWTKGEQSAVNLRAYCTLPKLAAELRAALDRENIISDHNSDLRRKLAKAEHDRDRLRAEVERFWALTDNATALIGRTETAIPSEPNASTGRQTARNRPDIPSDAGVPSRIDIIGQNGNDGLHYGDAEDGSE